MAQMSDRRRLLRWAFLGIGYLLLFGRHFTVHYLLMADMWADWLFGTGSAMYAFMMAAAYFYVIGAWFLCMLTSWSLRRNKPWAPAVGMAACVISLPWFPVMTLLGGVGIYFLMGLQGRQVVQIEESIRFQRAAARRCKDYWLVKKQSRIQPVIATIFGIGCLLSLEWAARWAAHRGIPPTHWGGFFWGWFFLFGLFQVAIHESGHAIVAWALYYRVRVVSIGPFLFTRDAKGFHYRFDWRRLFEDGGYTGSTATNDENLRLKHIAVVAAGPAASAISGIVFMVVTLVMPGTSSQSYWWVAAFNAVLGITGALLNLIPVGYSDGSMLYHLIRNTEPGRILLANQFVGAMEDEARAQHDRADFQKEIETRRAMLAHALEGGSMNSMTVAICHQMLGYAFLCAKDWPAAEAEFASCLPFEAEMAAHPALAANVWSGLVHARRRRLRVVETGQAYATAVALIRGRKAGAQSVQRGMSCVMLAEIHARTLNWQEALDEANEGLKLVPLKPEYLILYANLLAVRAEAHFNQGRQDASLSSATDAATTFRSTAVPAATQNFAAHDLGDLGEAVCRAGNSDLGVEFVRDAIARLEAGGAHMTAKAWRIELIGILRQSSRLSEAARSLPPDEGLPGQLHRDLLTETAELALLADAFSVAADHARTVLELWEQEKVDCAIEIAAAKSLLARALLGGGQFAEAETQAAAAIEVLKSARHPEAALCLLTLGIARHATTGTWAGDLVTDSKALLDAAVLLTATERAWWTATVDRAGKVVGSEVAVAAEA